MKNLKTVLTATILSFVLLLAGPAHSFAQTASKEVFNSTVDQINCETIRFIHRENNRAEAANTLQCLSFEEVYKSIPADEEKTTGALCKNINEYKKKFSPDKPLEAQINAVIAYANSKITAKKRKNNVEDFKANLEKIKKEALENAAGAPKANGSTQTQQPASGSHANTATANDSGNGIQEPPASAHDSGAASASGGKKTDWLGLLSLLIALGALGLAYIAYNTAKKAAGAAKNNTGGNNIPGENNFATKESIDQAMREIKRVEQRVAIEMADLKKNMENQANPVSVKESMSAQYAYNPPAEPAKPAPAPEPVKQPEPAASAAPVDEPEQQAPVYKPEPIPAMHEPAPDPKPADEPSVQGKAPEPELPFARNEPKNNPEPPKSSGNTLFEEKQAEDNTLFASAQQPAEVFNPEPVMPQTAATPQDEPFMPEKEYEDGEAVPFYMYAGLPDAEGNFNVSSFTSDPVKDSVYEIEMYEDVPDKAFFSILPNPEVIRKALLEPEVYLAPCCSYSDDPDGKRTIVLVEEGMLRKMDNKWTIYEKAKINFE